MPRLDVCPLCGAVAGPSVPMIGVFLIRCSVSDCGCAVGGHSLEDAAERWNRRLPRGPKELVSDDMAADLQGLYEIGQRLGWPEGDRMLASAAEALNRAYPVDSEAPRRDPQQRNAAERDLLLLLAQLVVGTMLRPDAGLLIYLDDGRSTVRHIPVNVREKLLQLMSAVGT